MSVYTRSNCLPISNREIGRMDGSDLSRDTSGTRAYAAFLMDMTERCPAAVLPNISLLLCHLDGEVNKECHSFSLNFQLGVVVIPPGWCQWGPF